ncbi:MAG: hypothetical protein A4E24_01025 [Methanomethylovorans sp. PtaU1.Bin093]|uniref:hypothetical protein n=1 Tax=Methanomethylovorans sp. PtaU1.Bin093 TaxID=1811679 RepID=UPI0009C534B2|nr:hypothetical protein [Methanomethylovorans sp. PtaU1.Bin093]OPY20691.1 MAG: hypothetical protein A4E24_01025 [Methanomethylovorans sp. PtaU1.Bin093]
MNIKNYKVYSIHYGLIVGDILDALGEDILYSYSHVSSNLYNIIESMEFDKQYLHLKAVDELDPSDKEYWTKVNILYRPVPKIILDWSKVAEVMDEWFDDNYNSDIYVAKDFHKILCALARQLYEYESEILTIKFRHYVDTCNERAKNALSQCINNDNPLVKCRDCNKLAVCKLVEQGFTDICGYKEQTQAGHIFYGVNA